MKVYIVEFDDYPDCVTGIALVTRDKELALTTAQGLAEKEIKQPQWYKPYANMLELQAPLIAEYGAQPRNPPPDRVAHHITHTVKEFEV